MSMVRTRSRSLVPWALRTHSNGALAFGLGLAALVAISGASYAAAAKAFAGGIQALGAQALPIAQQFAFLTGPAERLDTVSGYLSYKVFGSIALIVALYAAVQGSQVVRGAESKGLVDLWLAAGRSRSQILRDRVLAFLVALVAIVALIDLGTGLTGPLSGEQLWGPVLGQGLSVAAVGLVAFSLALLISQFLHTARTAAGLASVFLVATYFVANISDSLGTASFLRFFSPFFYYLQNRTLVPGRSFDLAAVAVPLGVAVALTTAAWLLFRGRDAGDVVLAGTRRAHPIDYSIHRSRVVRRRLWIGWMWEQRLSLGSWCAGIFTLTAVETAVVPTALDLLRKNHGALANLAKTASLTDRQYVSFILSFVIVVVSAFIVTEAAHWVGDASHHRTDAILAQPVGLPRFVAERMISLLLMSTALAGSLVLGASVGAAVGGYSLDAAGLLRTFVEAILFGLGVGAAALLAVAFFRSAAAPAVVGALLGLSFFLTAVTSLFHWPDWTNRVSVFDAYGSPYQAWSSAYSLAYLLALGVLGAAAMFATMKRCDRVAA